jgi:FSR family fosmidomycin resistance protein-like MFS transporter
MSNPASVAAVNHRATLYPILFAISLVHLFNDSIQSVIPAIFPILQEQMKLTYTQLGFVGFALSFTASLMQPVVGIFSDARPTPGLLPLGMVSTFLGMLSLAFAPNYTLVLCSVFLVGIGSAVFHPEASRVAYMAAGQRRGLAQSIYQVGGNGGQALAPLMAVFIFYPLGQFGAIWFTLVAGAAILVQLLVARWYRGQLLSNPRASRNSRVKIVSVEHRNKIVFAVVLIVFLVFARSWYGACISNYYLFYLRDVLSIKTQAGQYFIFAFLAAGALGTFLGGPLADRFGRKTVLFLSMMAAAPFALLLPYAGPALSLVLLIIIGLILLSSFSVTVVYVQELVPGKIGTVTGLITGLAFGLGAIGSVALGNLADFTGISFVMKLCSFLPLLGMLTVFLPSDRQLKAWSGEE